jgi:hypothetical protein
MPTVPITSNVVSSNPSHVLDTTLCDEVCWLHVAGGLSSQSTLVSSTNKTDHPDITEILLKVVFKTITHNPLLLFVNSFS